MHKLDNKGFNSKEEDSSFKRRLNMTTKESHSKENGRSMLQKNQIK